MLQKSAYYGYVCPGCPWKCGWVTLTVDQPELNLWYTRVRTVHALPRALFWYIFPELRKTEWNKHKHNAGVSVLTVRHKSIYIIPFLTRRNESINDDETTIFTQISPVSHSLGLQYIPRNIHTVFALLCFVVVIHWLMFPYPSGLLHWHCGNLTIAPVPAKQPWWIWINTSCEFIMNDCVTTTKQSTTKPCAYILGYTVHSAHDATIDYWWRYNDQTTVRWAREKWYITRWILNLFTEVFMYYR